jgi:hypothetical protein
MKFKTFNFVSQKLCQTIKVANSSLKIEEHALKTKLPLFSKMPDSMISKIVENRLERIKVKIKIDCSNA